MTADLVVALTQANLALTGAIAAVLVLRRPLRRLFGARIAYTVWAAVPAAGLAAILPVRTAQGEAPPYVLAPPEALLAFVRAPGHAEALLEVWVAGLVAGAALLCVRQLRFLHLARRGAAGPAVVGVIAPRIVAPAGYWDAFDEEERRLIRAHERAHIQRGDPRSIALIAALQCLAWFNPLVHLAARKAREDQELACDATVLETLHEPPRRYAETLLKSQLVRVSPPLGCQWMTRRHPLEERILCLGRRGPTGALRLAGLGVTVLVAGGLGLGVWLARPPAPPRPTFVYPVHRSYVAMDLTPSAEAAPPANVLRL